jgi:hypothetical protein
MLATGAYGPLYADSYVVNARQNNQRALILRPPPFSQLLPPTRLNEVQARDEFCEPLTPGPSHAILKQGWNTVGIPELSYRQALQVDDGSHDALAELYPSYMASAALDRARNPDLDTREKAQAFLATHHISGTSLDTLTVQNLAILYIHGILTRLNSVKQVTLVVGSSALRRMIQPNHAPPLQLSLNQLLNPPKRFESAWTSFTLHLQ